MNLWSAIGLVSGGATLVAFLAACVAWIVYRRVGERERLIESAEVGDRPELILATLDRVAVDTTNLTREQRHELALEILAKRHERFRIGALLAAGATIAAAVVTVVALLYGPKPDDPPEPPPAKTQKPKPDKVAGYFFQIFAREQPEVAAPFLDSEPREIRAWYQFFDRGLIVYNSQDNFSWIIDFATRSYEKVDNPEILISEHHLREIDWERFEELFATAGLAESERTTYSRLLSDRQIIGGIGTIYVQHALHQRLGPPASISTSPSERTVSVEKMSHDVLRIASSESGDELVVGLPNRPSDQAGNVTVRAVWLFREDGGARRYNVDIGDETPPWENDPASSQVTNR